MKTAEQLEAKIPEVEDFIFALLSMDFKVHAASSVCTSVCAGVPRQVVTHARCSWRAACKYWISSI